ncbi:XisH family protein [Microcoleus sp. FACHB-1515]|uniref:XisH family protein n=1 Tax=Cyanophyceae TaxID=3028117 RepID=UPI001686FE1C|nr:XisH family protein [Microcoleus sp. FACHB-1515]MBD2092008.1 XisH family protein [Microcoleus sp. FACHB-1515]
MPARDVYHGSVKNALLKDGWTITAEDYVLEYGEDKVYVDLAAEKTIAAEKQGRKIAVEVKSFLGRSFISDFEDAIGQYILYRDILSETEPERQVYLAVATSAYNSGFQRRLPQMALKRNRISVVIFNADREEIFQWID